MGAKSGQSRKAAGFKRLALVVFSALFVVLFLVFAIAQGIGQPSVPSGDAATVKGVSDGNVSEAEFKRSLARQVSSGQTKKLPKRGTKKYEELKAAALGELLDAIWIGGEAEALGITVTDKQIETELANVKKQNFPTEKAYQRFLKTSHFTQEDVDERVELQLLSTKIQEKISAQTTPPSSAEIAEFYEASKATQFTVKPSRDVYVIFNNKKSEVEKAKQALEKDDSEANWKKVAIEYSSDPTAKEKGGLQEGLTEELLQSQPPLKKAIFDSASGEIVGPTEYQKIFFLTEVKKLNPEKVKSLAEVKSEISTQLTQQKQQEYFGEFVRAYEAKWTARTFCGSDFLIERCANFPSAKRIAKERESYKACYEANPKTPATECPAPVTQTKPALPGTVTILKPKGEPLVQRPRPEASKEAAGKGAEALEGAATEAAPETGE
ncbi:MAG: SurA N-terminal domain-containing protein [Solirubrobacterales bacterium]